MSPNVGWALLGFHPAKPVSGTPDALGGASAPADDPIDGSDGRCCRRVLLGIEDVTGQRASEREKEDLLREKDVLLQEMQHRVANSLQIIASIILMKARAVQSEETRLHLRDAHSRVMSIAAVQEHLHASAAGGPVEITPYLSKLCETLATSMIGDVRPISLKVSGDGGGVRRPVRPNVSA